MKETGFDGIKSITKNIDDLHRKVETFKHILFFFDKKAGSGKLTLRCGEYGDVLVSFTHNNGYNATICSIKEIDSIISVLNRFKELSQMSDEELEEEYNKEKVLKAI